MKTICIHGAKHNHCRRCAQAKHNYPNLVLPKKPAKRKVVKMSPFCLIYSMEEIMLYSQRKVLRG